MSAFVCRLLSSLSKVSSDISNEILVSECFSDAWDQLASLLYEVYLPLISAYSSRFFSSAQQAKNVVDSYQKLLFQLEITRGHIDGKVILPLPPSTLYELRLPSTTASESMPSQYRLVKHASSKDVVHFFETTLIAWTRIIKGVLRTEVDGVMPKAEVLHHSKLTAKQIHQTVLGAKITADKTTDDAHAPKVRDKSLPGDEIRVRQKRVDNLRTIVEQLASPKVQEIIIQLETFKSPYTAPFRSLEKEVGAALRTAENIVMYSGILKPWFDRIASPEVSTDDLIRFFPPTLETIMLIWNRRQYLSSERNLNGILSMLCNQVRLLHRLDVFLFCSFPSLSF
jgi:dynein heavy chain